MKKEIRMIGMGLIFTISSMSAQKGVDSGTQYGKGEDSIRCVRNFSLYSEDFKNKNYDDAYPSWFAVLEECPKANVNIYIDGVRLVKHKMEKATDQTQKEELFQLLMRVYDMRMQYFGTNKSRPTPAIKGDKALDMIDFDQNLYMKEAFQLLEESIQGMGNSSQSASLLTYNNTSAVLLNYANTSTRLYIQKDFDAAKYINCFSTVSDIVEAALKNQTISETARRNLEQVKVQSEQWFAETDAASCENLENIFTPQLEENKENLAWLKRVSGLLVRKDCKDSKLFFQVAQFQHEIEPSAASAYGMAKMNQDNGNLDNALEYYIQAVELADNDDQKGLFLINIANIHFSRQNYQQAKTFASRALEARPNWGMPLLMIGRAYAMAATSIGKDDFEQKAVYWAAVDKFIRAKTVDHSFNDEANNLIRTYSAHFPGNEEIFMQGYKIGDSYTVGGWINERTTVRDK